MTSDTDTELHAAVFLQGDSAPFVTTLTVEQVAAAIFDAVNDEDAFIRLPHNERPDALARPRAIVAISPIVEGDDDELDDD